LSTVTRTVLFTDLANYTQTVGRSDRSELRKLIAEHERFTLAVLTRHGGRVVKNLGDSYMALFTSATDAIRAGVDAVEQGQRAGGLLIRAACATGDVEEIDGDAFGDAVNLAARVIAKTPSAEFWFSESTKYCMNQSEVAWECTGSFEMKGFPGNMPVFRAVIPSKCTLPEPIRAAVKQGRLTVMERGATLTTLPPNPTILLMDYTPNSDALERLISSLPVLEQSHIWLAVYNISPIDRHEWQDSGRGLVVGAPNSIRKAIEDVTNEVTACDDSHTIIFDLGDTASLQMMLGGLALPVAPMANVVDSYSYDLLPDGAWSNGADNAVLRVKVNVSGVAITALSKGVELNGRIMAQGDTVSLDEPSNIVTPSGAIEFIPVSGQYSGLLMSAPSLMVGIATGSTAEIGRDPTHPGLSLPDRRGHVNVRWCSGSKASKARQGGFTMDRALAGRRQAAVTVAHDGSWEIQSIHDRCITWLLQKGNQLERVEGKTPAKDGDIVVMGTSIVRLMSPKE
jgi:class 3 adenylate cyclase